ncbi:hypothetical protein mRhiFer1_005152 [Rhinolophus ferrumequinum]|uniref:Cystatin fetuin-B-type domain-containing protein n=1 Tax=Rhinolophus ferrumequinum TaxID=59479 RepID=A0A7J8AEU0_RHIFE|nr:hypothetical protein mRhiFer1_005152 [Rhinolophus ferrumequinum]
MGLLLPLAVCMLATSCMVASLPEQVLMPSPLLLSHGCNNSDVLAVAGFALQDINSDRKDGYVLSLNRVNNVQEHRQDAIRSVHYLTLDVLETNCHVLSKKAWRDCGERILHESVYGQCKAIIYVNKPRRILYSPAYNCTLRPVSRRKIHILEAATESLAKYNKESTLKLYSLFKVTRASSQWVFGPSYFVEYLTRELPCTKSPETVCVLHSAP